MPRDPNKVLLSFATRRLRISYEQLLQLLQNCHIFPRETDRNHPYVSPNEMTILHNILRLYQPDVFPQATPVSKFDDNMITLGEISANTALSNQQINNLLIEHQVNPSRNPQGILAIDKKLSEKLLELRQIKVNAVWEEQVEKLEQNRIEPGDPDYDESWDDD